MSKYVNNVNDFLFEKRKYRKVIIDINQNFTYCSIQRTANRIYQKIQTIRANQASIFIIDGIEKRLFRQDYFSTLNFSQSNSMPSFL